MVEPTRAVLRQATARDADALLGLCRDAFPASLRWAGPAGGGRRWWRHVLADDRAETWLAERPEGAVGFTLLVIDEQAWARSASVREAAPVLRALAVLAAPEAAFRRVLTRLAPPAAVSPDPGAPHLPAGERVFVELFGVARAARGRGVARQLVAHGQRRAAALGRGGCCYRVERGNAPMLALMASEGYRITGTRRSACFLCRVD